MCYNNSRFNFDHDYSTQEGTFLRYLFQFAILAIITFLGEILNYLLPLPIPASIYGLFILFVALCTKIIKLEQVEGVADFFLSIMPILFVPASVNLMTKWSVLKDNLVGLLLTCMISTVVVMGVTGMVAQRLMSKKEDKK